jgi:hypothetical protein
VPGADSDVRSRDVLGRIGYDGRPAAMSSACSIGDVLLQPERLARATGDRDEALLNDVLTSVARVVSDTADGGTMAEDLVAALEGVGPRLIDRAGDGIEQALTHLEDLVRPLPAMLQTVIGAFEHDEASAITEALLELLRSVAETTAQLSIESVREHVATLLSVLQDDLGLTPQALDDEVWALVDDAIARLEATPDGLEAPMAANRLAVAGTLRRLKRRGREVITFPALDADAIAAALLAELDRLMGPTLKKVACAGHVTADSLMAATALESAVTFTGFGSRSIGAADAPPVTERIYLWYATWLFGDGDIEWWQAWRLPFPAHISLAIIKTPPETLFRDYPLLLSDDRDHRERSEWRAACGADAATWRGLVIPVPATTVFWGWDEPATDPSEIPRDKYHNYSFKNKSPDWVERFAYHSAWAADATDFLMHVWSPFWSGVSPRSVAIKKGGMPSVADISQMIVTAVALTPEALPVGGTHDGRAPRIPLSFACGSNKAGRVPPVVLRGAALLAGSLQGIHWNADAGERTKMWLSVVLSDYSRASGPSSITTMLREAMLSFITLWNHDGPDTGGPDATAPDNRSLTAGLLNVFELVMNIVLVKGGPIEPKYYGPVTTFKSDRVEDLGVTVWLGYVVGLGIAFGCITGFLGTLVIWAILNAAGSTVARLDVLIKNIAKSVLKSVALLPATTWSTWMENATEGGRLNLEGGMPFRGYPSQDTSPYKLPWEAGTTWMCGQGNLGGSTHNLINPLAAQTYAYDFMLDMDEDVLAARDGTVVDFFDWVPGATADLTPRPGFEEALFGTQPTGSDSWNFVAIRHDPDEHDHDRGESGVAITTYAVYGHGRFGSVRATFEARGVGESGVIGTRIRQGEPIMSAGSTGDSSSINQVHMEVRQGPPLADLPLSPTGPQDPAVVPVDRASYGITIPFVFADAGNPQSSEWVQSGNERVPVQ